MRIFLQICKKTIDFFLNVCYNIKYKSGIIFVYSPQYFGGNIRHSRKEVCRMQKPQDNNIIKAGTAAKKDKGSATNKALTVIGIVLCVILIPILIVNCTLIVKSFVNKDDVPDFGGVVPLIVLTDSMYPEIKSGDLIICKTVEAEDVQVGDVISFFDPAGNGTSVVTHKVKEIYELEGKIYFRTYGTNNNTDDRLPVSEDKLVGKYADVRIAYAGNVALFMQTVPGLIICVVLPIVLLVGYDFIRRRKYEKGQTTEVTSLMAELEALKAAMANQAQAQAPVENAEATEVESVEETKSDEQ